MNKTLSRKNRRKAEQTNVMYRNMRKSAAVMGTTLTACSVITPLVKPVQAEAVDTSQAQVATSNFAAPNTTAFITEIATYAQPIADANDLYASVMIAQAIIESGWGQSALSKAPNYNLFGIKGSYNGQTVYMNTLEYLNNQWVTMKEPFKKYPSFKESFEDNARTIKGVSFQSGVYYYSGAWKSNTNSYQDATAWLTGRYATAPNYASALNNVIVQYGLTKYDTPASGNAGGGATTGTSNTSTGASSSTSSSSSAQTYTVVSGDSVWGIANKYGITMDQLRSWNNIKNNFVYPGQKLVVTSGGTTSSSATTTVSGGNTSSTSSSSSAQTYTVVSGDSVWGIANKYGITMDQLRSWNNIKNNFVYPGQKLVVTSGGTTSSSTTTTTSGGNTSSASSSSSAQTYTVVSGDSVWGISSKYGITMDQLRSWNNIKNDFVYPGQKLVVTSGGTTSSSTTTTASGNTSSTSTSSSSSAQTYTVVSGDSVWGISSKYGITMDQLRSWNNIKNDFVYPGQKLTVKNGTQQVASVQAPTSSTTSTTTSTTSTASSAQTYTVVSGDSVWSISNKYGITMDQFRQWNNIKNDFVYPGQKVKVSEATKTTSGTTATGSETTYTVESGDSVWSISNKYGITMNQFIQWNAIKDNFVYPGQKVKVKG